MLKWIRNLLDGGIREGAVYDLSGEGVAIPLALRQAEGSQSLSNQVGLCKCGVMYFLRPTGSAVAENGECRRCATGQAAPEEAKVVNIRRRGK